MTNRNASRRTTAADKTAAAATPADDATPDDATTAPADDIDTDAADDAADTDSLADHLSRLTRAQLVTLRDQVALELSVRPADAAEGF